ncbi:MAG TPA: UDP-N-acetylmuramate dehydrogenase [Bryobacteraceae bacterium]|nr:UDP-N-acetylmuramate dehydrogenase [Bryobacteraceae bacterium]
MPESTAVYDRLAAIEGLTVEFEAPLSRYTRFGLGGPADVLADASSEESLIAVLGHLRANGLPFVVIGGGSNLVCSDDGYRGAVIRYTASEISAETTRVKVDSGAELQAFVDFTIEAGLSGVHTMTGIPGWLGGAIYGNAGAYGRSTHETVRSVRFLDGDTVRDFSNAECGFRYRHSGFKDNKHWIVLSSEWELQPGDAAALRKQADEIRAVRDAKYPPTMKCAGSIFKNLLFAELPDMVKADVDPKVVREGKVPSAYFLERVDAKGMKNGDIHVADYHANLIYNAGSGTAVQVRQVVNELKRRVRERFGFEVEEEVQYVGF